MDLLPLVGLCLLTRTGSMFTDEDRTGVSVNVTEGRDVILPCSFNVSENSEIKLFEWKTDGQKQVFLYNAGRHDNNGGTGQDGQFKRRVFHFEDELKKGNASIKIKATQLADDGNYTCTCLFPKQQTFHLILNVERSKKVQLIQDVVLSTPHVTIFKQTKTWALLRCVVKKLLSKHKVEWRDSNGSILPVEEPEFSSKAGWLFVFLETTVTHTDHYRCVATGDNLYKELYTEIHVFINGAAAEPSVTILNKTVDGVQLQCSVRGASPKPKLEWMDSCGNILPAEESQITEKENGFDVFLQTTVTRADCYSCVATQEEVNHQVQADIFVPLSEFPTRLVVSTILWTLFIVGVILVVFGAKGCIYCKKAALPPETTPDQSEQNCSNRDVSL